MTKICGDIERYPRFFNYGTIYEKENNLVHLSDFTDFRHSNDKEV